MMPGETHSKTAGLATEGTGLACQNCSALQQNLNEYVDALVALKQKIIETDHLLSKYQQKCDELQRTERENGTLRHQLEQMLQKIATHDHCQREIQSLQAELEEKKSSVKIYQNIQEEYIRIKEECDQSIVGKKKLEARVKKLEDAVAKHNSDVKQLKMEKKVMAKELKKTQEKLDGAEKQSIRKKKMKHAVTQFTAEEPVLKVDKNKVKRLLEELWVCFDSATQEQKNKDIESMLGSLSHSGDYDGMVESSPDIRAHGFSTLAVPVVSEKVARKCRTARRSADYFSPPGHSSLLESSAMLKGKDSEEATCNKRNKVFEEGQVGGDSAFYEERSNDVFLQKNFACSSIHCSDQDDDDEDFGVKLHHVLNWARPLPPLLSPVQLSPSCTQNTLFGELTDSSDEEVDCSTSNREPLSTDAAFESQLNCTFVDGQENCNKEKTFALLPGKEMEQEIETTKEKHVASSMLGNAGEKKKRKTATLTSSLSEHLKSSESASRKPMESEETLEQIHTVHPENTSELDEELELIETPELNDDQILVETTEIMLRNSEHFQIKPNEPLPSQEKTVPAENTATNHEHLQERLIKIGLPADTCTNTEESSCILQFGVSSCGVHDSLTTHENSQVTDNVKNIVSMNPNLEAIKSRPVPNEESTCGVPKPVEESYFKTGVAGLCTDNSMLDSEKDATVTNAVVHRKLPLVTAETECKLVNLVEDGRPHFEHSYSCLVPECANVAKLQSCECKVTSGEVINHVSPKNGRQNMTISIKVTERNVQHLGTISVEGMKGNGQNVPNTPKSVTPIISAKQTASNSDKTDENSTNHSANSNSPNKQFDNFETNLEKYYARELKVSCTSASHTDSTQTVKVDSKVLHPAVLTKQAKLLDENKEETDSKTIFVSVESERECAENILLLSNVNVNMDELSQTPNEVSSQCLPDGSSLTSTYETQLVGKSLQAELRTEPELNSPVRRRSKKRDLKSFTPKKATDFAPFVVEPEHRTVEISNHMQPEKAYIVSEQKAGVSNSTRVNVTSKPASPLNANRGGVPEQHETKANVKKVVLCTDVTNNVDPLEHSKIINSSGTESSLNDVADKLGDINNEEMAMKSCNTDKCKGSVASKPDPERCVINDNEVVDQLSKCNNKFVPFMDHEAIAKQFLVESSDFVKKVHSSNTMFDSGHTSKSAINPVSCSVEQIVDHPTSQQSKLCVISEIDSSDKHEAHCHDAGESDKGIPNLPVQQTEEEGVVNSAESKPPCCLTVAGQRDEVKTENPAPQSRVIHEMHKPLKKHKFVSVDSANDMPLENSSIPSFESVNDHFITDHTCLDFHVLSRCSGGVVSQNRIAVNDLVESDCSVALESINAFLENSEKVKNGMKGFCPEKFTQIKLPPNVSSLRNASEQPEKKIQGNAHLSSAFKQVRYVEDSDLEEEFPVRRVGNRKHKNYRKPAENNDFHDVAKLTEMMTCITTAKVYKACKNPSTLSSDDTDQAGRSKTHFPASILPSVMNAPNVNAPLHTAVLTKLSEINAEAAPKEVVGFSKVIDQKKCNLVLSADAKVLARGSSARHYKEHRNSDTDSVPDDMAHNAHRMNELEVRSCAAAVNLTITDPVILVKTGAKDSTSKEKPEESHEASSEDVNISSVSQQYDEDVLDLSITKMQQRSCSPVGECSLETTPSVKTNGKKARPGKNYIWKIPILDSNPFATRKSLRPHSSGVSNVNVKSLNYNAQQILNNSEKTVSEAPNKQLQIRVTRARGKVKTPHTANLPTVANADTSTATKRSPETISKVRSEMGPPLPPLLQPLIATPPRSLRPLSPIMSTSSRSSLPSPLDDIISPLHETPVAALVSPLSDDQRHKSQFTTPSPSETPTKRIVSSPLQFCAATPKHALPVPGRLPLSASGNVPPVRPQDNSVRILDSMYPELSAQARTLNILKGNIQLSRCPPTDSKNLPGPVSQITGFKTIASTSTAFVKTVKSSKSDSNAVTQKEIQGHQSSVPPLASAGKRAIMISAMPRSAKRLCLGNESPNTDLKEGDETVSNKDLNVIKPVCNLDIQEESEKIDTELPCHVQNLSDPNEEDINNVIKKIGDSCFDLLPVICSNVQVGNISRIPVMRDEEKEVVHECTVAKKVLAEPLLHTIAKKLKDEMMSLDKNYLQALCRVYVGICRQLGDLERARLFCYSLLKEDFPESDKLTLFVLSVWQEAFTQPGVVNKAMQSLVKQRAKGEIQTCLTAYFKWDKGSPLSVSVVLSSVLMGIQLCPNMKFQSNEQFGEDLSPGIWEYVFAIDLLCSYRKWTWTHDNVISKDLWPIMDKWVKHRKGHLNVTSTPDIIVAAVLRLIGRLSQIGLKEGFISAVKNISSVICSFIQHAKEEDMPWGVQLASVYALCDMASSDPAGVFKALQTWRTATVNNIPPEVNRKIADISSLCMQLD